MKFSEKKWNFHKKWSLEIEKLWPAFRDENSKTPEKNIFEVFFKVYFEWNFENIGVLFFKGFIFHKL